MDKIILQDFKKEDCSIEDYVDYIKYILNVNIPQTDATLKKLFIDYVGINIITDIKKLLYPRNIEEVGWIDICKIEKQLYKDERTILASRIDFIRLSRGPTKSVMSYLKNIKELTRRCEFEDNVELRIRDQLIAGLKMSQLDKELRLRYPDTKDEDQPFSLNKVVELALAMERADLEINNTAEMVYKIKKPYKYDNNNRINQHDKNNRQYNNNDNDKRH
ncbi:unnamed protein product [Gordionus sp. m RMFG-2023]